MNEFNEIRSKQEAITILHLISHFYLSSHRLGILPVDKRKNVGKLFDTCSHL